MRFISKPSFTSLEVFDLCVSGIIDTHLNERLNAVASAVHIGAADYDAKASAGSLYLIPPNDDANDAIVVGAVTKAELKSLYTSHMVPKNKPARSVYDKIRANAPGSRCPFCGMGSVYTVDHYLPKAKFPLLSVTPANLVPSCGYCNKQKTASYASTAEKQTLHPYYDHGHFINERWIHAVVVERKPASVRFIVNTPAHWDTISKQRAIEHFSNYHLAMRYAVESADQITILNDMLNQNHANSSPEVIQEYLRTYAEKHEIVNRNSWSTALHYALSESRWYCGGGFKL